MTICFLNSGPDSFTGFTSPAEGQRPPCKEGRLCRESSNRCIFHLNPTSLPTLNLHDAS